MVRHALLAICCAAVLAALEQNPPPAQQGTRPPENNDQTMRPLSPEEIPPNLNFYAIDPLYRPGTPLGWSPSRIDEHLNRGLVARVVGGNRVYLGWRLLKTDPTGIAFNVYRSSGSGSALKLNTVPITTTTDYVDPAPPLDRDVAWSPPKACSGPTSARRSSTTARASTASRPGTSTGTASTRS